MKVGCIIPLGMMSPAVHDVQGHPTVMLGFGKTLPQNLPPLLANELQGITLDPVVDS